MSEHMSITGPIDFQHLPYEEKGSFSYCHRCNTAKRKLTLELHQGWSGDWIKALCPGCKKTIWVAELKNSYCFEKDWDKTHKHTEDCEVMPKGFEAYSENCRVLINDNKKCAVCKKPTNHYDCACITYNMKRKRPIYLCSNKCYNKRDKMDQQKRKKSEK
jgi:hypothetical protein